MGVGTPILQGWNTKSNVVNLYTQDLDPGLTPNPFSKGCKYSWTRLMPLWHQQTPSLFWELRYKHLTLRNSTAQKRTSARLLVWTEVCRNREEAEPWRLEWPCTPHTGLTSPVPSSLPASLRGWERPGPLPLISFRIQYECEVGGPSQMFLLRSPTVGLFAATPSAYTLICWAPRGK